MLHADHSPPMVSMFICGCCRVREQLREACKRADVMPRGQMGRGPHKPAMHWARRVLVCSQDSAHQYAVIKSQHTHMAMLAVTRTGRTAASAPSSACAPRTTVTAHPAARCARTAAPSGTAAAARRRRNVSAAGEGRSANRTKWASGELSGAGGSAGAAVLEPPPPAGDAPAAAGEQQDASELVRFMGPLPLGRSGLLVVLPHCMGHGRLRT